MKKGLLSLLTFLPIVLFALPWAHRYATEQSTQNIAVDINASFTLSVEWGEGDWDANGSMVGYGTSINGTGWVWVDLPFFQNGTGSNKRCKTSITISTPGKYYYAYRFVKGGTTSYSFGSDTWFENSSSLSATSTISVGEYSVSDGSWSSTSVWNSGSVPDNTSNVGIYNTVSLDQNAEVKSLYVHNGTTFTASDATAHTLTIASGGTLTNNGTFTAGTGTVSFGGGGIVSGTVGFNNVSIAGGVNFGANSTVSGILQINAGGYVNSNAPTYLSESILRYNTGTDYGISTEWYADQTTGAGVPYNVDINSSTQVHFSGSQDHTMNGTFTIASGKTFSLSMTYGADLFIKGDFINNGGTFNANSRLVTFNGSTKQEIKGTGSTSFGYVTIANSAGVSVNSAGLITVQNDLSLGASTSLWIEPGKSLTVNGTLTNNAGNSGLVIKSDATGTGSLKTSNAVNATVERHMNNADFANWKDGWHFLGSPVASQAISPAFTTDPAASSDFYLWNEPTNEWINFKNQSSGSGTAPFFDVVNGSNNFVIGRGYMAAYDNDGVKSFAGVLNVADVPLTGMGISSGTNKSWHLLGNPFSSALAWDGASEWALSNVAGVIKIWNEVNQSYTDISSSPSSVIPSTNGFLVQVSSGTGSLTIPASKRIHSTQAFYKSSLMGIMLIARSHTAGNAQEARVMINPDASDGFDLRYDGEFLAGHAPTFYSVAGELKLSTNSIPELTNESEIPFTFVANEGNSFTIEASGLENIIPTAYLHDLKTGTISDLRQNPVYEFNAEEGDAPNRFKLTFGSVGIANPATASNHDVYVYGRQLFVQNPGAGVLEIFNFAGQLVLTEKLTNNSVWSQPLNLSAGQYVVRVVNGSSVRTAKVVL